MYYMDRQTIATGGTTTVPAPQYPPPPQNLGGTTTVAAQAFLKEADPQVNTTIGALFLELTAIENL